jgi:hypothetical protein
VRQRAPQALLELQAALALRQVASDGVEEIGIPIENLVRPVKR